jgi:hypothetical protein
MAACMQVTVNIYGMVWFSGLEKVLSFEKDFSSNLVFISKV